MESMDLFSVIFFGTWAVVGAAFLLTALILWKVRTRREQLCTETASGIVVELAYYRNQSGGSYCPVVEFAAKGETLRVRSGSGSRPARYAVGQAVEVHYDPDRPKRFYIEDDRTLALLEKIFLFSGLACILIGSFVSYIVSVMA